MALWDAPFWHTNQSIELVSLADNDALSVHASPARASAKEWQERAGTLAEDQASPSTNRFLQRGRGRGWSRPLSDSLSGSQDAVTALSLFANNGVTAASHQILWLAAAAHLPAPKALEDHLIKLRANAHLVPQLKTTEIPLPASIKPAERVDRWSLDTWAFWRQDAGSGLASLGRAPSYGASQAGAVARYSIAPQSAHRPRVYMRTTTAWETERQAELATGVSARLLGEVPLRLHGEARYLSQENSKDEWRASAFVTSELPQARLPMRFKGEAYFQAGYVTGQFKTGFADGQLHLIRDLEEFNLEAVKLGAAAFAGAQKGVERIDVGPSARIDMELAQTPARLSIDWRERVAGNAEPRSGLAVTLSTQF